MKRIAIILSIVFLTCQFSYAMCPYEQLMQRMESQQELTKEEVDEILYELIERIGEIKPNQGGCILAVFMAIALCPGLTYECQQWKRTAIILCLLGV